MPGILPQFLVVFLGGLAAVSWQVLWQQDLSLALGVSERGTAITVAAVMSGMSLGAWWAGRRWRSGTPCDPWLLYGTLELLVGALAWLPSFVMGPLQNLDGAVFRLAPSFAPPFQALALALTVGPSCMAMGATFPLIALVAGRARWPVSRFYAVNTAGSASGAMMTALLFVPLLGRTGAAWAVSGLHLAVLVLAVACSRSVGNTASLTPVHPPRGPSASTAPVAVSSRQAAVIAVVTGFCTFALEVSHFRLLRAAWLNTTDSFAAMLFCFLIALSLGAWMCKALKKTGITLPVVLMVAAITVCLATPLIERFDLVTASGGDYATRLLTRMVSALLVIGFAVLPLGVPLPWLLDECRAPREWARFYALNTIGCVFGSIAAGWWLMPLAGPVVTCWLAGAFLGFIALGILPGAGRRLSWASGLAAALSLAFAASSGIGTRRAQGPRSLVAGGHQVLAHLQGPGSTTSVIESKDGSRWLLIDGYAATGESGALTHYMDAMGRLPMLLHPSPKEALVICFGTGQTVRGVLDENPASLTVVDVNPAVFKLAGFFKSNRQVLSDPRVHPHVMDGRAWLRRTSERYDVVTLEPMPPFFAGSNALYSVEFYELIRSRLREGGFVTQWFPLHLMTPSHARAIAAAFVKVFPRSMLWFDPASRDRFGNLQQGVLIGCAGGSGTFDWPGFQRPAAVRPLTHQEASAFVLLNSDRLAAYAGKAAPVTDDNQILAFGFDGLHKQNLEDKAVTAANFNELWQFQRSPGP